MQFGVSVDHSSQEYCVKKMKMSVSLNLASMVGSAKTGKKDTDVSVHKV